MIAGSNRFALLVAGIAGMGIASVAAGENPERDMEAGQYYGDTAATSGMARSSATGSTVSAATDNETMSNAPRASGAAGYGESGAAPGMSAQTAPRIAPGAADRPESRTAETQRQRSAAPAAQSTTRHNYSSEYKPDLDPRIGGLQRESAPN